MEPSEFAQDFANSMIEADARRPQAINVRSKVPFQPGLGPHTESQTIQLVVAELQALQPARYRNRLSTSVPYPEAPRQKCDLCIGESGQWEWAIEVKMLRILGDNGKPNDNILMHILSPYSSHRSALSDCDKLARTGLGSRKMILIYGYESDDWPLEPTIGAFEALAARRVTIGERFTASFEGLVHPVHANGQVIAWEIRPAG